MRLSDVLSNAPENPTSQVEGFLGPRKVGWGRSKTLQVGKIIKNCFCFECRDSRTFLSGDALSCVVTGDTSCSIDAALKCSACGFSIEAWFLLRCDDDMFGPAPRVHLERYTENTRSRTEPEGIEELLEKARTAFESNLGAGAMIYLRKIYEVVTSQAATAVGIPTKLPNNKRKTFRRLLEEVDEVSHIVPVEFAANRYNLFSELSEVIHGDSSEADAIAKYEPCRKLIVGVIRNIQNSREMAMAVASLGWNEPTVATTLGVQS
jgi:hypothetical protein